MPDRIIFSPHAHSQLKERKLNEEDVLETLQRPDEVVASGHRLVTQKVITLRDKPYLLRVIYEELDGAALVVTLYITSRIAKYRGPQ